MEMTKPINRIIIRVGHHSLSFSALVTKADDSGAESTDVVYEPFVVKSGVSMAANLREAFHASDLLMNDVQRVRVLVDTPVLMVPVELFEASDMEAMYRHSFPGLEQDVVLYNVQPDLNTVAVFSINKDLKLVLTDHYQDVQLVAALTPVWRHFHRRSFTGVRSKLYGYFHEGRADIFAFQQNRFKFCNQFETKHAHDALYFLLYVWNQLALSAEHDELHLVGDLPKAEWLTSELRRYVQKVFVVNPAADLDDAPVTKIKGMPYDLMALFTQGR